MDKPHTYLESATQRENLICGNPPRVLPKKSEDLVPAAQLHLVKLRGAAPEIARSVTDR